MLATMRVDERLDLAPQRLRREVPLVAELTAELRQRFGLVIASERAEFAPVERALRGEEAFSPRPLRALAVLAEVAGGSDVVAVERCDLGEHVSPREAASWS